jgi:hypothetical protein
MPIPDNYRDICEKLLEVSEAGRVNWLEEGATYTVRFPKFNLDIWSGLDMESDKQFVALGLKDPSGGGLLDNWYVDEDDRDFEGLRALYASARRHSSRVRENLEELRRLLGSKDRIGLDDTKKQS